MRAVRAWRESRASLGVALRWAAPGAAYVVALTVLVFVVVPPQMRVQFDETCLVGTSQNMHLQRLAVMTTGAVPSAGEVVLIENMVDKRPTLFAFLVSFVHDLTGYRLENAFFVNGALLALGLFVMFAATRAPLALLAGLSAPPLVLSVPLPAPPIAALSFGASFLMSSIDCAMSSAACSSKTLGEENV